MKKNEITIKKPEELLHVMGDSSYTAIIVDWDINDEQATSLVTRLYSKGGNENGGEITADGASGFYEWFSDSHKTEDSTEDRKNFIRCLDEYLGKSPESTKIIDAACGEGKELEYFASLGYKASGFDATPDCVEAARVNSGCEVVNATLKDFRSDKKVDAIWTRKAWHHVAKSGSQASLQNLTDHLKPGGILFVITKSDPAPINGVGRQLFTGRRAFFNLVTEDEIKGIVANMPDVKLLKMTRSTNNNPYSTVDDGDLITFVLQKVPENPLYPSPKRETDKPCKLAGDTFHPIYK
ncbi:MAG: class I SAM-dependent methyltransferase [Alphaproteobacteria bacterium]|nr:class I SAM-dependent methyltransferase [Alphaproteobacteria bacterium]